MNRSSNTSGGLVGEQDGRFLMDGLEPVFESKHSSQVILGITKKGKEVLVDRPVPARDVGNFRPASRWAEKEYEEIPFSVIRVQGTAQLLVISGRRNLNGTLFSIENTNCEFVAPQDDEDRFFPYCVLFGNDPYLVFDLVGELLDLRIKLRIKLLKLKLTLISATSLRIRALI